MLINAASKIAASLQRSDFHDAATQLEFISISESQFSPLLGPLSALKAHPSPQLAKGSDLNRRRNSAIAAFVVKNKVLWHFWAPDV